MKKFDGANTFFYVDPPWKPVGSGEEWKDFDAIVTDLRMPWMNGAEFCRRSRRIRPDMLIYALSGYIHEFDRKELLEAGFDGIFSKPIRIDLIRDAIEDDLKKIRMVG